MKRSFALASAAAIAATALVAIHPLSSGAAAPCRLSKSIDQVQNSYSEKRLLAEIQAGGCITITYGGNVVGQLDSLTTAAPTTSAPQPTTVAPTKTTASTSPTKTTASPSPTKTTTSAIPSTSSPTTQPPTGAPASSCAADSVTPDQVLGLGSTWYEGTPFNTDAIEGNPDTVKQPKLATYELDPWFCTKAGGGVAFRAPGTGGTTTENSTYLRSELREMKNGALASWNSRTGTNTLTARESIDINCTCTKPQLVAAQIHDGDDDVLQVRLEGTRLQVNIDGSYAFTLTDGYVLGTQYDLGVTATSGGIDVSYNGVVKGHSDRTGSGWYFRAGAYAQFRPDNSGADATDHGQVTIYSLTVSH